MTLNFDWTKEEGYSFRPESRYDPPVPDAERLLSNLLGDDGGLSIESATPWLDDGVSMLDSVLSGQVAKIDWDRERWGAQIEADRVTIYYLLQEDYSASISTQSFRRALLAWRDFVRSGPLAPDGSVNKMDLSI